MIDPRALVELRKIAKPGVGEPGVHLERGWAASPVPQDARLDLVPVNAVFGLATDEEGDVTDDLFCVRVSALKA